LSASPQVQFLQALTWTISHQLVTMCSAYPGRHISKTQLKIRSDQLEGMDARHQQQQHPPRALHYHRPQVRPTTARLRLHRTPARAPIHCPMVQLQESSLDLLLVAHCWSSWVWRCASPGGDRKARVQENTLSLRKAAQQQAELNHQRWRWRPSTLWNERILLCR